MIRFYSYEMVRNDPLAYYKPQVLRRYSFYWFAQTIKQVYGWILQYGIGAERNQLNEPFKNCLILAQKNRRRGIKSRRNRSFGLYGYKNNYCYWFEWYNWVHFFDVAKAETVKFGYQQSTKPRYYSNEPINLAKDARHKRVLC